MLSKFKGLIGKLCETNFGRALICAVIVIVLEATLFNVQHWLTINAGPKFNIEGLEASFNDVEKDEDSYLVPKRHDASVTFNNINKPIRTIRFDIEFINKHAEKAQLYFDYDDEDSRRSVSTTVYPNFSKKDMMSVGFKGNVSELKLSFKDGWENVVLKGIYFNEAMPFYFHWLRVILLWLLLFAICAWRFSSLGKTVLDADNKLQKNVNRFAVFVMVFFLFIIYALNRDLSAQPTFLKVITQSDNGCEDWYNKLADSFLAGRLDLDKSVDQKLIDAEKPYSYSYRGEKGINYPFDTAYYDGKLYVYYGVVPVLITYLPFKALTGNDLSSGIVCFIFAAVSFISLFFLWRSVARRYIKNLPYSLFLAGYFTLCCCSMVTWCVARPWFYEAAALGGLMFVTTGVALLFSATKGEKLNRVKLVCAAACLALAVGTRPNLAIISVLLPVIVWNPLKDSWKKKNFKELISAVVCVAIPYIIVAAGLMWYNYVRFDSVFEFGSSYNLTSENNGVVGMVSNLNKLQRVVSTASEYLFAPIKYSSVFPFAHFVDGENSVGYNGYFVNYGIWGVMQLPVSLSLLALPWLRRKKGSVRQETKAFTMLCWFAGLGLAMVILDGYMIGILQRYATDFLWLFMIAAVSSLCLLCQRVSETKEFASKARHAAIFIMIISAFPFIMIWFNAERAFFINRNPELLSYFADMFAFWK